MSDFHQRRRSIDAKVDVVKKYWHLIAAVVLTAVAWGALQTRINYIEKKVDKESDRSEAMDSKISQHEEALKVLPEMRDDIKKILRGMRRNNYGE